MEEYQHQREEKSEDKAKELLETIRSHEGAVPRSQLQTMGNAQVADMLRGMEDAVAELERYTMGYVDSYLRDGREMLREAKQRRKRLQDERRRLEIS